MCHQLFSHDLIHSEEVYFVNLGPIFVGFPDCLNS